MTQPLLQPCLLLSENCPQCEGTAERAGIPCADCEGSGREVREVPLSEVWAMAQRQYDRVTAPPPSELRAAAVQDT